MFQILIRRYWFGWLDPDPHSLEAYFPNVTFSYLDKFWEPTFHFLGKIILKNLKIEDTSRCVRYKFNFISLNLVYIIWDLIDIRSLRPESAFRIPDTHVQMHMMF